MSNANIDLRFEAKKNGVYLWQIAEELKIHDSKLSRILRHELPEDEKEKICSVIKKLAAK